LQPIISDPAQIEKKSFEIIEGLLKDKGLHLPEKGVVVRVVHATADPEFADLLFFSDGAVKAGIDALRSKCNIIADVNMLKAGISKNRPGGREAFCFIADPMAAASATKTGTTRAVAAMRMAASIGHMDGAIVVVGNAPTALYEVMRLVREEGSKPALIVGVPVGFVGAAESKDELMGLAGIPFITNKGKKGGSPVAAAIINAIIKLAA
jgi:precorrin-8X/cobalt-precorrin-8 methylmutase